MNHLAMLSNIKMINSSYVADPLPVELIVKLTSAASQFDTLIKGLSS